MNRKQFFKKISLLSALAFLPSGNAFAAGARLPEEPEVKPDPRLWSPEKVYISWIGHSTMLMSLYGKVVITDPVFSRSIGLDILGLTIGPARFTSPALTIDEIPKPDLVLLSHAHMDHMDYPSLRYLAHKFENQIDCVTAYNTMDVIEELPWKSVQELDWGKKVSVAGITLKALKTRHFGWRFPWERDRSRGFFADGRSYNAYLLERKGKRIVFGGDTALTDDFLKSDEKTEIAMMPIGAYYPWRVNHCSPEEAVAMAADMHTKIFIPMHCNTFKQGMEPVEEPMARLHAAMPNSGMVLGLNSIGETYETV
jgi:L-ascorbate metabolism protein UlaG (beta-lactamase superfamily)